MTTPEAQPLAPCGNLYPQDKKRMKIRLRQKYLLWQILRYISQFTMFSFLLFFTENIYCCPHNI